jgi:ubiquitin-protein ligase
MPNQNDPLTLRANLFILDGPYKDLLIHLVIHIPSDYPMTGPAANIAPGLKFGHKYHEHLFDDLENGNQICSDLLTNMRGMYDSSRNLKSGWMPAYTLSSVLLQLQVFFADTDLPKHLLPKEEDIEALRQHVRSFKTTIELSDGQTITHSFDSPYPAIPSLKGNSEESKEQISKKIDSDEKEVRRNAEEWLYCAISKCTFFDERQPILEYPLHIRQNRFGRY